MVTAAVIVIVRIIGALLLWLARRRGGADGTALGNAEAATRRAEAVTAAIAATIDEVNHANGCYA